MKRMSKDNEPKCNTWNNLDLSDDEDRKHPNVHTPSLFKWRHSIMTQRSEYLRSRKTELENKLKDDSKAAIRLSESMRRASRRDSFQPFVTAVEVLRQKTDVDEKKLQRVKKAVDKLPLSVEDLMEERESRTYFCKKFPSRSVASNHIQYANIEDFLASNEGSVQSYGWLQKIEENVRFLEERRDLLFSPFSIEELSRTCVSLAVQEKFHALRHVAAQFVFLWHVHEAAKKTESDPLLSLHIVANRVRLTENSKSKTAKSMSPLHPFRYLFHEVSAKKAADEFCAVFNRNVEKFVWFAREQASKHIRLESSRELELLQHSLDNDPLHVLNSLPEALRQGFENQDVVQIGKALRCMSVAEVSYHMGRCVQSKLWRPDKSDEFTDPTNGLNLRKTTANPNPKKDQKNTIDGSAKLTAAKSLGAPSGEINFPLAEGPRKAEIHGQKVRRKRKTRKKSKIARQTKYDDSSTD